MTIADALAINIDWDLDSGKVSIGGNTIGRDSLQPNLQNLIPSIGDEVALAEMSKGDSRPADIAIFSKGQPLTIELNSLKMALKEFETGLLFSLNVDEEIVMIVKAGVPRYRIAIKFDSAQMVQILQKYADPRGTFADVITELELTVPFRLEQNEDQNSGPDLQELPAGVTTTLRSQIPLDLADGETKSFAIRADLANLAGHPLSTYTWDGSYKFKWTNIQHTIKMINLTATRSGSSIVINSGAVVSDPVQTYEQIVPQYVPRKVWLEGAIFNNITATDEGVEISVDVTTEEFDHPSLALPETVWVCDLELPKLSWGRYGQYTGGDYRWLVHRDGTGAFWNSTLQVYLLDDGAESLAITFDNQYRQSHSIAQKYSTAIGSFWLMTPDLSIDANAQLERSNWRLLFDTEPQANAVRVKLDGGTRGQIDHPIVPTSISTTAPIELKLTIEGQEIAEAEARSGRLTSSSFVTRLRRDLIPDAVAEAGSGSA